MNNILKKGFLTVPVAIIVAGLIIGAAVIYSVGKFSVGKEAQVADVGEETANLDAIRLVDDSDHIRGGADAKVTIVEFSDLECPFCKRFHSTMQAVLKEYGDDVAWVYRHFPLDQLHSKARTEAKATECAAELGGNEKFWAYTDRVFEVTPSNNGLNLDDLPKIAEYVGLNKAKFQECLDSDRHEDTVEAQVKDALATGAQGTPYSVLITADGEKFAINGAQPIEAIKQLIDAALK